MTQTIAPFLITLQIANWSGSANVTLASGTISSFHFVTQAESTTGEGIAPDEFLAGSTDAFGETPPDPSVAVETTTNIHHDN